MNKYNRLPGLLFILPPSSFSLSSLLCFHRQKNRERGATTLFGTHADRAAVIIDCFLDNGKAKTGACLFCRIVRLEYLGDVVGCYSSPRIDDIDSGSIDGFRRQQNPHASSSAIYSFDA